METNTILDDQLHPKKLLNNPKLGKVLLIIFYTHIVVAITNLGMALNWHFLSDEELYQEFLTNELSLNSFYDYFLFFILVYT